MRSAIRVTFLSLVVSSAFAATIDEVGDVDSFGRGVKYLGMKSSAAVYLEKDCTPDPAFPREEGARCLVVPTPPAALTIDEASTTSLKLPAYSARSLLCFTVQPIGYVQFLNDTPTNLNATLSFRSTIRIESDVLKNPALIDPDTGVPYNGRIEVALGLFSKNKTIAPAFQEFENFYGARVCSGGLINKRTLIDAYGLTNTQATSFFARPITLTFGLAGTARTVQMASISYGVRIYGD